MHRLVTNCPDGLVVDHINHNTLDNRKSNLRICTHQENMQNRKLNPRNKSGITGVHKCKDKFYASICANYKIIYLGSFNTLDEARKVREQAELKYFTPINAIA